MISNHGVQDYETFVKAEPEEYEDQFGDVFVYGNELHITSMEDDRVEMEMYSDGIWKGFVLSDEMCDLGNI